jgi:hypothetical protein
VAGDRNAALAVETIVAVAPRRLFRGEPGTTNQPAAPQLDEHFAGAASASPAAQKQPAMVPVTKDEAISAV